MNILVEEERPAQALVSNVRSFVEQQQYSFDTLWQKAIPAQERIREIEEAIRPDFIETIRDATEIQKLSFDLIKSAKKEILILFSTPDSFRRQVRSGLIQLLKEVAIQKHVRIRILVHITNKIREILSELKSSANIEFRNLQDSLQTRLTTLVVDGKFSKEVEVRDDTKESSSEAVGLASYSNQRFGFTLPFLKPYVCKLNYSTKDRLTRRFLDTLFIITSCICRLGI